MIKDHHFVIYLSKQGPNEIDNTVFRTRRSLQSQTYETDSWIFWSPARASSCASILDTSVDFVFEPQEKAENSASRFITHSAWVSYPGFLITSIFTSHPFASAISTRKIRLALKPRAYTNHPVRTVFRPSPIKCVLSFLRHILPFHLSFLYSQP